MDPEFGELIEEAITSYRDDLLAHHQDLVFNGIPKKHYDNRGNLVSETVDYPIRLIELELKKHDEGYRDKKEVGITHRGGVLVAPAEVESVEDWEAKFGGKVIEGELADVADGKIEDS